MKKGLKTALKAALCVLGVLILTVGIYAAYVFINWYRVEDNLPLTVETTGREAERPLAVGETYRIVSYNVGFGAYSNDYSFFMDGGNESRARSKEAVNENIGGATEEILRLDPDFLFMEEVDVDGTRSWHINELNLVKEALGERYLSSTFAQNYDSPYLFWPLLEPHGANQSGIAVFSRYPIASALRRSLPIEESLMKLVDLDRCYSVQRISVPGSDSELVLYALHLSAYTSDGTIATKQLQMLFTDMLKESEAGNWCIAGGDFNKDLLGDGGEIFGISGPEYTWAQPIPADLIPAELSVIAPFDADDPVPSCRNSDIPYGDDNFCVTVDGFVVSANVEVIGAGVVDTGFRWSDHNPVYMDFILR
ncbi:MAG: endonuclease/exonuclease/phosphatase family protein [Lachnospiraceae bacterium]|nr:endonuclease/exonuclease/phosphatase family protein [Lachnospiraceae bacterium]